MSKTIPVRAYKEDLQRIELQRRKLSVKMDGKRVTIADTIRWMLELAETQEQRNEKQQDYKEGL